MSDKTANPWRDRPTADEIGQMTGQEISARYPFTLKFEVSGDDLASDGSLMLEDQYGDQWIATRYDDSDDESEAEKESDGN